MQKILVVDDAEINRELLREILEDEYDIETAENGEQALRRIDELRDEAAAILLDLQMPVKTGIEVVKEMRRRGWMSGIPVLVVSSEYGVDVENECLELGVSDFIHKPFEASIVKNRVRNTIELFNSKHVLEERVKLQSQIIRQQADQLTTAETFKKIMMEYSTGIMEIETRLNVLNAVFSAQYNRNPFESIHSRLKQPESIYKKLVRKNMPVTVENIREYVADVAGVRVICSFPDDIYRLAELLIGQDDIVLLRKKDYIKEPKPNGYRSLHLILNVPVFLPNQKKYMKVEVQFRTIAMDFWASLEHKLRYKNDSENMEEIERQLKACADSIEELDYQMQEIRDKIDFHLDDAGWG